MHKGFEQVVIIGAGTIGTAIGNILSESGNANVILHSIEKDLVESINLTGMNIKYFPHFHLHPSLKATTDDGELSKTGIIFLAIPSGVVIDYLKSLRDRINPEAIVINLAKGFGNGHRTIYRCFREEFRNPFCSLKGPSFAREIINHMPTGFTLGTENKNTQNRVMSLFGGTAVSIDTSDDIEGVEILSILKNIYAIVLGVVDAIYNSPNIRFLVLTKAYKEMRTVLVQSGGKEETMFNYCGFGDFTLTALNDLSRNRTLGLLIGKGFFTENVSHELVLEGQVAVKIFYEEISRFRNVDQEFPIISSLHKVLNRKTDIPGFVNSLLK